MVNKAELDAQQTTRQLPLEEIVRRGRLMGLSPARAIYLSRCAHTQNKHHRVREQVVVIPYSDRVLLEEAARLGISLKDTARMMGMSPAEVAAFGITFPTRSMFTSPNGSGIYCLFEPRPKE